MKPYTYGERVAIAAHPLTKKILLCMEEKQTNVGIAADLTHAEALFNLIHQVGPHICILKTHIDILQDFSPEVTRELQRLAAQYQFLIFEDRKFADIGQIVQHQYEGGMYRISDWADIINAHVLPGPGVIQGLKGVGLSKNRGLLLIAQMSSAGNFLTEDYTKQTLALAQKHADFVIGFISQKKITKDPTFLHMTPGVQLQNKQDTLGQQYITPEQAFVENQTDIILVGRGICQAENPKAKAIEYQTCGWALAQK